MQIPIIYQEAEAAIGEQFWANTKDGECAFDISKEVGARLERDNAEKDPDYYEHRPGVVHVTSLAKCLRGVALELLGAKKDPLDEKAKQGMQRKLGIFKAGNLFEDFAVDALGDRVIDRQTEYIYRYKGITLTGRDDGTFLDEKNERRMLENKSVNSDSFWYREKEGTLVQWHNQIQVQTYLWLRRTCGNLYQFRKPHEEEINIYSNMTEAEVREFKKLDATWICTPYIGYSDPVNGYFCYISKDDCTIIGTGVKYNPWFVENIITPVLDMLAQVWESKDAAGTPLPSMVVYNKAKGQFMTNWLASYCDYHCQCENPNWKKEAAALVARKNKEQTASLAASMQ